MGQSCVYNRADGFGYVTPTQECGPNGREPSMEFHMRNKTLTSSMAGALLFGGTLGGATAANAGVVGIAGNSSAAALQLAYDGSAYQSIGDDGSPMDGPVSFSDSTYGSVTCSQFTASGFSLVVNSTAAATQQTFFVQQNFTVTEAVNFTLTGYLPSADSGSSSITAGTTFYADSGSALGAFSTSGTLQAGTYRFVYTNGGGGSQNRTLFNLSFSAVPAPGAIALLGAAGLIGGRRRRA